MTLYRVSRMDRDGFGKTSDATESVDEARRLMDTFKLLPMAYIVGLLSMSNRGRPTDTWQPRAVYMRTSAGWWEIPQGRKEL